MVFKDLFLTILYTIFGFVICSIGQSFDSLIIFSCGVAFVAFAPYKFLNKYGEDKRKNYVYKIGR